MELLVEGCDHGAVAEALHIARTHIENVITKIEVHSRLEVVALVTAHGLLDRLQRKGA